MCTSAIFGAVAYVRRVSRMSNQLVFMSGNISSNRIKHSRERCAHSLVHQHIHAHSGGHNLIVLRTARWSAPHINRRTYTEKNNQLYRARFVHLLRQLAAFDRRSVQSVSVFYKYALSSLHNPEDLNLCRTNYISLPSERRECKYSVRNEPTANTLSPTSPPLRVHEDHRKRAHHVHAHRECTVFQVYMPLAHACVYK